MTVKEAIAQADGLRLNTLDDAAKAEMLREVDGELLEMMAADEPTLPPPPPIEASEDTEADASEDAAEKWPVKNTWPEENATLLLPFPHDGVYVKYLCAQIDFHNMETDQYENDMAIYNASMSAARAWWRRNHRPRRSENWRVM